MDSQLISLKEYKDVLSIGFFYKELCTRCGTCGGVCPVGAISLSEELYPVLDPEKCIRCGTCKKTCPGGAINFNELSQAIFNMPYNGNDYLGHYRESFAGCAADSELRTNGSSGGLVTQLLVYMMDAKIIDGAIVVSMDSDNPTRSKAYIARSREELLASQKSKYMVTPVNRVLSGLKHSKEKIALVGLPCHIQGFRKWSLRNPNIAKKVPVTIGLYCYTNLEPTVASDLLRMEDLDPAHVSKIEFRGGKWPGHMRAIKNDGSPHPLHYADFKDGANIYLSLLYSPKRCQMCVDGSSEFADLSVADGWIRDKNGKYKYDRMSTILARTQTGQDILHNAQENGYVQLEPIDSETMHQTHWGVQKRKKQYNPIRISRRKKRGLPVPQYDWETSASLKVQIQERINSFLMSFGLNPKIRFFIVKILLSKVGVPLIFVRKWKKEHILISHT